MNFKVVVLGEGCVGKTSLTLRYCENTFNDKHITTIQASFLKKMLNIDGKKVTLAIWDTAGQERFHALGPIYYRDANGALLVYDITDKDSFIRVKNWVKELRKMLGTDVALVIAGNKIDMEKNRTVSLEEAEAYAATVGATHYSTSAKLNKGVDELFFALAQKMIERSGGGGLGPGLSRPGGGGLTIGDSSEEGDPNAAKGWSCCGGGAAAPQ
eukprot:TRINITY_DN3423_c0_g2_i10.p1 TRINITY_DN3423_c0_g2~~TRINITY_DN3423_c0_g2_i10.p1  ORF type:complete len:213 (+),score=33.27 TRINITY_DN3423_c0_g2_i10:325-963(+)